MSRPGCALRALAMAAAGASLLAALGCSPSPPRNLLLVVVDTLRADRLGCYGHARDTSPALDALAASGVRFERAYSVAPWTAPSVATLLTGRHPREHGLVRMGDRLSDRVVTLAERLQSAGYATGAVVSHSLLSARFGFGQGFATYDAEEGRGHRHVSGPSVTARAETLLEGFAAGDAPFFLFAHYFDPHFDYLRHPGIGYAAGGAGRLVGGEDVQTLRRLDPPPDPGERAFLGDLYDEEVHFTDRAIGALLRRLDELGLADDTLVVVTADHGEEIFERGWLGHTRTVHEEVVRVPLIVRDPTRTGGGVVSEPVSLLSLAPSLLDLLGRPAGKAGAIAAAVRRLPVPPDAVLHAEVDVAPPEDPRLFLRRVHLESIVQGDSKLIVDRLTGTARLYDLAVDPHERNDLAASQPERVRALLRALAEFASGLEEASGVPAVGFSDDEIEGLRELGYVEPTDAPPPRQ